ncbi:hypothetical protein ABW19_dt0207031 [Dactylella cylindrospora]|nr:hypothetical protein ABW19_dt0207031 [Dactylella cylindrospora]
MRITSTLAAALTMATLPLTANAWGFLGHKTVALLASRYFLPETAVFVRTYLYKDQTIMDAAVWADRYAHLPFGRYSKTWHYIDAKDNPPEYCHVSFDRDCDGKSGCIVSALINMTERIQNDELRWADRAQALRFILHFLGDIHQPLHTENKLRGGNGIKVLFDGKDTNLHSVWDSKIIEEAKGGNTERQIIAFANELEERLETGAYVSRKEDWAGCLNITDVETCSLTWAQSANDFVCSYVLKGNVEGTEVSGEYATGAVPIIEQSIATAGYRLAGWLNMIVTGTTGFEDGEQSTRVRTSGILTGLRDVDDGVRAERELMDMIERQRDMSYGIKAQH